MEQPKAADIVTMKNLLNPVDLYAMDEDFLLAKVRLDGNRDSVRYSFNGMIFYFCSAGRFHVDVNDRVFTLKKDHATTSPPGCTVKLNRIDAESEGSDPEFTILAITQKYFFDLKIDMGELLDHLKHDKVKLYLADPTFRLSDELIELLSGHCELLRSIHFSGIRQKDFHYNLLLSSMLNIINTTYNGNDEMLRTMNPVSRSKTVFTDFMKLAVENFELERGIRFYADKLCLTPKYLSKLIKEECGNSASTIIDNLVVAKAKNLLKHTDYPVKMIAAKLNFSSQSSFNKFFKTKTGMSPLKFKGQ